MPAYLLALLDVRDPQGYQAYIEAVPATIRAHGGRYVARTPQPQRLEGGLVTNRVAVVAFPTLEAALGWHRSKEYQAIAPIRQRCAPGSLVLVPGLA
ncbi:MAG TPA: DUF1330 domain-containing protein [Candidatus Thermoplasmatota archaeon]|jgi:uncharacterized protein (DUF1330 family)|nr:DUF1330 domain-containing protein [Candidatus Thermoplasmatota archaeon]